MAKDYSRTAATALRLLTKFGRSVQLVKLSTKAFDDNFPWKGSETLPDTTISVTAAFVDPVSEKDLGSAEIIQPETSVKMGVQIAFIAANENLDSNGDAVDLTEYHRMIDGGLVYRMVEIHTLSPGGTPLMYEARLER